MYNVGCIDWYPFFTNEIKAVEDEFSITINVNIDILHEIKFCVEDPRLGLDIPDPTIIQTTGYFVFWINELKPLTNIKDSKNIYNFINERVALMTGFHICSYHKNGGHNVANVKIEKTIINNIIYDLRYKIYSPESLIGLFEIYYHLV